MRTKPAAKRSIVVDNTKAAIADLNEDESMAKMATPKQPARMSGIPDSPAIVSKVKAIFSQPNPWQYGKLVLDKSKNAESEDSLSNNDSAANENSLKKKDKPAPARKAKKGKKTSSTGVSKKRVDTAATTVTSAVGGSKDNHKRSREPENVKIGKSDSKRSAPGNGLDTEEPVPVKKVCRPPLEKSKGTSAQQSGNDSDNLPGPWTPIYERSSDDEEILVKRKQKRVGGTSKKKKRGPGRPRKELVDDTAKTRPCRRIYDSSSSDDEVVQVKRKAKEVAGPSQKTKRGPGRPRKEVVDDTATTGSRGNEEGSVIAGHKRKKPLIASESPVNGETSRKKHEGWLASSSSSADSSDDEREVEKEIEEIPRKEVDKLRKKLNEKRAQIKQLQDLLLKYHRTVRHVLTIKRAQDKIESHAQAVGFMDLKWQNESGYYILGEQTYGCRKIDLLVKEYQNAPSTLFPRLCEHVKGREYCRDHKVKDHPRFDPDCFEDLLNFFEARLPNKATRKQLVHYYNNWRAYEWQGKNRPVPSVEAVLEKIEDMDKRREALRTQFQREVDAVDPGAMENDSNEGD